MARDHAPGGVAGPHTEQLVRLPEVLVFLGEAALQSVFVQAVYRALAHDTHVQGGVAVSLRNPPALLVDEVGEAHPLAGVDLPGIGAVQEDLLRNPPAIAPSLAGGDAGPGGRLSPTRLSPGRFSQGGTPRRRLPRDDRDGDTPLCSRLSRDPGVTGGGWRHHGVRRRGGDNGSRRCWWSDRRHRRKRRRRVIGRA